MITLNEYRSLLKQQFYIPDLWDKMYKSIISATFKDLKPDNSNENQLQIEMFVNILLFLRIPIKEIQQFVYDFVTINNFTLDDEFKSEDRGLFLVEQLKTIIEKVSPFDRNLLLKTNFER